MTAAEMITELSKMGVSVDCPAPGRIRLTAQVGDVPPDAVALARDNKPALIGYLCSVVHEAPNCRSHIDTTNYVDTPTPDRLGWVRTTCRVCGRFIGYRPSI